MKKYSYEEIVLSLISRKIMVNDEAHSHVMLPSTILCNWTTWPSFLFCYVPSCFSWITWEAQCCSACILNPFHIHLLWRIHCVWTNSCTYYVQHITGLCCTISNIQDCIMYPKPECTEPYNNNFGYPCPKQWVQTSTFWVFPWRCTLTRSLNNGLIVSITAGGKECLCSCAALELA